ncbi:MAG: hypothetical protein ACI4KM_04900 [Oscillospiraceae bacterium]
MKTVIIDNSLCALPFSDEVQPDIIYRYLEALGQAGVKYAEIDFRTVMKMHELPEGIGYIFRLTNPMFAELTTVFDFDYVSVTLNDLKKSCKLHAPVIMEFPGMTKVPNELLGLAQRQLSSRISMIRLRGSYEMLSFKEVSELVLHAKNAVPVPIDICPMNARRTALDIAIKSTLANADSVTMGMGLPKNFASFEEYLLEMMSFISSIPQNFNLQAVCRAAVYHKLIFGEARDGITQVMELLDKDIESRMNVDTGERVRVRVRHRDFALLQRNYLSVLERMAQQEEIPEELAAEMFDAIKRYDASLFENDLSYIPELDLLN